MKALSYSLILLTVIFNLVGCGGGPDTSELGELGAEIHSEAEVAAFPKALHPAAFKDSGPAAIKFQSLPPAFIVQPLLTPMAQGTPGHLGFPGTCIAWSVGYGLGTFTANQTQQWGVDDGSMQVSPAFLYEKILQEEDRACPIGTKDGDYLNYLVQYGSPSLATVPYQPDCTYLNGIDLGTSPDPRFKIGSWQFVSPTDRELVKAHLAEGLPLAFAGRVYVGFGDPTLDSDGVYHGSDAFEMNPTTGQLAGHGMFLVGYNDTMGDPELGQGAYLIMNSFGNDWAENGFIWMSYEAFENSQLTAFTAQPLIPFDSNNGTLLTANPDQNGIPQAVLMDGFQWVDPSADPTEVYLIFTYQFEAPVQVIEFVMEGPSGAMASHPVNAWQNNSYNWFLRKDGQQFLSGTYTVTINATTQDGTDVSYTGTLDVAAPSSGGDALPPAEFLAGLLGGNGQPATVE